VVGAKKCVFKDSDHKLFSGLELRSKSLLPEEPSWLSFGIETPF
jgi:hypothetical protein